jgi:hypothetical protein
LLKPRSENIIEDVNYDTSNNEESNTKDQLDLAELEGAKPHEVEDLSRKPLDLPVYNYYFKAIGVVRFSIFLFFAALQAFASSFSSAYSPIRQI